MAGEIQLNGTTALTESGGAVTLNNVNSATNRTNLGLGTAATSASTDFVGASRTITAGTGLSGGGDLSANRTINVSFSANESNVKTALNASGSAPIYACRAWVNFNGTGTVAIRDSGNVSSITDNGTGDYTVNFTTAMPNANYAAFASAWNSGYSSQMNAQPKTYATGSVSVLAGNTIDGSNQDFSNMSVNVFL